MHYKEALVPHMKAPPHNDANVPLKETPEAHKNASCLSRRYMCLTRRHLSLALGRWGFFQYINTYSISISQNSNTIILIPIIFLKI